MKEWKAPEKETQKITRDGAISVNTVTGETSRVSDRTPEQDYSPSGDSAAFVHSAAERLDDWRIHKSEKKKRRNRRCSLSKNPELAARARKQRYAGLRGKCCGTRVRGSAPITPAGGSASCTSTFLTLCGGDSSPPPSIL